jgi:hypothetical protein
MLGMGPGAADDFWLLSPLTTLTRDWTTTLTRAFRGHGCAVTFGKFQLATLTRDWTTDPYPRFSRPWPCRDFWQI